MKGKCRLAADTDASLEACIEAVTGVFTCKRVTGRGTKKWIRNVDLRWVDDANAMKLELDEFLGKGQWSYVKKVIYDTDNGSGNRGMILIDISDKGMSALLKKDGILYSSSLLSDIRFSEENKGMIRCYHCQKEGHMKHQCPDMLAGKSATCALCAGSHDTTDCTGGKIKCARCGSHDHSGKQLWICKDAAAKRPSPGALGAYGQQGGGS